ncbi:MAG TPA: CDP-alcohol phosphatidyltransferase family protein [Limnochordia bacterium]|nr:CDP-alcohol phosphatidyltransferase family protein [Limnochordia bacterium]
MNLANALTLLRGLGAIPLAAFLWTRWPEAPAAPSLAAGGFLLLAVTDWLDGLAARRLTGVTRFGQLADPLADKVLALVVLAALAFRGDWSLWLPGLLAGKEVALAAVSLVFFGGRTIPAAWPGKLGTVVLFTAVPLGLLRLPYAGTLAWSGVAISLYAGFYYGQRLGVRAS